MHIYKAQTPGCLCQAARSQKMAHIPSGSKNKPQNRGPHLTCQTHRALPPAGTLRTEVEEDGYLGLQEEAAEHPGPGWPLGRGKGGSVHLGHIHCCDKNWGLWSGVELHFTVSCFSFSRHRQCRLSSWPLHPGCGGRCPPVLSSSPLRHQ